MKKVTLLFMIVLIFNVCMGQIPRASVEQEKIKKTINGFLSWYKRQQENPNTTIDTSINRSIIAWEEIDTLMKPNIDMVAVEDYLTYLKTSRYLSETFINNLRQYHQKIKDELKVVTPSPKSNGIYAIPGLNLDIVFGSFEPEAIYDYYKSGIFKRISNVEYKAIVQFYIPPSSYNTYIKMLFTLTKENENWLIDYIGYYDN